MTSFPCEDSSLLICSDIRVEVGKRVSLIGVMGPSLEVPSVPAMEPTIAVFLWLLNPKVAVTSATVVLRAPDGTEIARSESSLAVAVPPPAPFAFNLHVKLFPFSIPAFGWYCFSVSLNGDPDLGFERRLLVRKPTADGGK